MIKLNKIQIKSVCDLLQCEESELDIRGYNINQVPVVGDKNKKGFAVAVYSDGDLNAFDTKSYATKKDAEKAWIEQNR